MATAAAQIRRTAAEDRKLVTELLRLLEDDDGPLLQKIEKFTLSVCDAFDQTAPPPPRSSSVDPTTSYPLACKEIHAEYQILVEAELEETLKSQGVNQTEFYELLAQNSDLTEKIARAVEVHWYLIG